MKIYQIEITNDCQMKCSYCPRTTAMKRGVGVMTQRTIDRIADIITSDSLRLHHYGESLLEVEKTIYAIEKFSKQGIKVELNTNGELLTPALVERVFRAGLSKINLSYHNELSVQHLENIDIEYRSKIEVMKIAPLEDIERLRAKLKIIKDMGYVTILKQLRDLGQVKCESGSSDAWKVCSFLTNNEFVVLFDGSIATCCEVYEGESDEILGNVHDKILPMSNRYIPKCATCSGYGNTGIETERIIID